MTSRQISNDSEDVRRSIDVLDKVLSEFDDIDPNSGDERNLESLTGVIQPAKEARNSPPPIRQPSPDIPPPIDRSLKPKISPPALPKKSRKSSSPPVDLKIQESQLNESQLDSQSSPSNTHSSKKSDASSHEYQEINSDLLGPVRKNSNQRPPKEEVRELGHRMPYPPRHRSQEPLPKSGSPHFRENISSPSSGPLRKSRSGEVSLNDDYNIRGRKHGHRQPPRRSRSSDRILDPRVAPPTYPLPHIQPHFDPRMLNPSLVDPRFMRPEFYDPRMADPRLLGARLPYHPKEFLPMPNPNVIPDPRFPLDGGRHIFDDSVHFPHLLNIHHPSSGGQSPSKPLQASHPLGPMDYPLNIPPYELPFMPVPPLLPEQLAALNYPLPYETPVEGFDPRMLSYIPECPMDVPMGFEPNIPFQYLPRERLDYGPRGGLRNWESRILEDGPSPRNQKWQPPSADEARKSIERLMSRNRTLCNADEDAISGAPPDRLLHEPSMHQRYPKRHQRSSIGHSDSSGRSSPIEDLSMRNHSQESRPRAESGHGRSCHAGTVPGTRPPTGVFRVGGAVRGNTEPGRSAAGKEVMSLPHFTSVGGKDSGFDESPLPEENSSLKGAKNGNPGVGGGGFIVSGVFNDSSKMYIPCPPSPTPDYDEEPPDTDDAESDILQGDIYSLSNQRRSISFMPKEPIKPTISNASAESKRTDSSNRDSLSEDSLQEGTKPTKKMKSLETMINEFHLGLPPPSQLMERCYSDDSLEESSLPSPSGPPTMDLRNHRPQSIESLVSMDGSTTSFDYMSGGASKSLSPTRSKGKKKISQDTRKGSFTSQSTDIHSRKNINEYSQDHSNSNYIFDSIDIASIPPPVSFDVTFPSDNSKSKKKSKKMENRIYGTNAQDMSKQTDLAQQGGKFDTIRNMLKDGLIEGLNDNPPDFKPPPISKKASNASSSEERTDSGIGSTISTSKTDESGGSDNQSDKSGTPPSSQEPFDISSSCDKDDNHNMDSSNNNHFKRPDYGRRHCSPPPPPPPPRDSSMKAATPPHPNPHGPTTRNHSWLHKPKRPAPLPKGPPEKSAPYSAIESRTAASVEERSFPPQMNKSNHNLPSRGEVRLANGSVTPQDIRRRIASEKESQENLNNLESSRNRPESLSVISEDQCSVSSHGSRSSKFFSRLSDSMKSGSRSSTSSSKGDNKNLSKHNPTRHSRIHADVIRNPNLHISKPILSPPNLPSVVSPSTVVPFTRDGSGRFRSIEDLAEESSMNKGSSAHPGGVDPALERKKKKHATLPPNLDPSVVEKEMKELRRATSLMYGRKNKDESDSSKFKFNIFKGFWRRNKYSFDKT